MQAIDAGLSQVHPSSMVPYPIYIVTWVKWENVDCIFLFKKTMRRQAGTRTYRSGKVRDVNRSTTTSREIAALIFPKWLVVYFSWRRFIGCLWCFFLVRKLLRPLMMCWRHQMVPHFTFWLNQGNTVCFLRLQTVLKAWKLAWPFLRIHKVQCDNLDCRQIHALGITTPC